MTGEPLFVVSDVHGYRTELTDALRLAGLVDAEGKWSGGRARLWFLGDYVDRGPDGVGVIEDVIRLAEQAEAVGGQVRGLLGNHELQFLAADRFGAEQVPGWASPGGMHETWLRWGGVESDLRGLTDEHRSWLYGLPIAAVVDDHLLVHSDTVGYLGYGSTIEEINHHAAKVMRSEDSTVWLDFLLPLTGRLDLRVSAAVDDLLTLGGHTIVHGHSQLTSYYGIAPGEVWEPIRSEDGRVLAIDGGFYEGGAILVVRLT